MIPRAFTCDSFRFVVAAVTNQRVRSKVFLYTKKSGTGKADSDPCNAWDLNLADSKAREEAISALRKSDRDEVRELLLRLGAKIAAAETQPVSRAPRPTVEPAVRWEDPVDGLELMNELSQHLMKYIVFPSKWATWAVALWIIMTHVHDASEFSPLLIVTSPTRGSGKSRVLEVLELLVLRPWRNLSPSDAVLFRKIDVNHPTLLIDEMDNTNWRERPALVAILNGGFAKFGSVVPRCVGEDFEPKDFSVWAPKVLASKGVRGMPDTTLSRSVVIRMQRRKKDCEPVARFRARVARKESAPLRAKLVRWAADHFHDLTNAEPDEPETISDRAADAWSPLLAIADAVGRDWGKQAREAADKLSGTHLEASDIGEELLSDIRDIMQPTNPDTGQRVKSLEVDRMSSADLVARLKALDGRPWAEWSRGHGLSTSQLASLLDSFGIGPRQLKFGEKNLRGYEASQFSDAFARNLSDPDFRLQNCYPATCDGTKGVKPGARGATNDQGSGTKSGCKSFEAIESSGVAVQDPNTGEGFEIGDAWEPEEGPRPGAQSALGSRS